jgi:hypothetical protein
MEIYGADAGHYGMIQMVDDTCIRAQMERGAAPIMGM